MAVIRANNPNLMKKGVDVIVGKGKKGCCGGTKKTCCMGKKGGGK